MSRVRRGRHRRRPARPAVRTVALPALLAVTGALAAIGPEAASASAYTVRLGGGARTPTLTCGSRVKIDRSANEGVATMNQL